MIKVLIWMAGLVVGSAFGLWIKGMLDSIYTTGIQGDNRWLVLVAVPLILGIWLLIPLGYYFARKVNL